MATLYLGPELPATLAKTEVIHCPLLRFVPIKDAVEEITHRWAEVSHLILTSKIAARFALELLPPPLPYQQIIAVGQATARRLTHYGLPPHLIAQEETAEGVIRCIEPHISPCSFICWPHSNRSRQTIPKWLSSKGIPHLSPAIYETRLMRPYPLPSLEKVDTIFFTSPSTVAAFWKVYGYPPKGMMLRTIGPITHAFLREQLQNTAPSETMTTCATN